jgi:UPF0755 protein
MHRLRGSLISAIVAILVAVAFVTFAASTWFKESVYNDRSMPAAATDVTVDRGMTFAEVTRELADRHVIAHPIAFRILARFRHDEARIEAGQYRLAPHESMDEVLRQLVDGGAQIAVWVTIPEGFMAREIAQDFATARLGSAAAYDATFRNESLDVAGIRVHGLEGYLFPSTYLMPLNVTPPAAAKIMTDEFFRRLPPDADAAAKKLHLTVPQVVVLASLIEREGKADNERPLIASVMLNRLRVGMPLQVDASIEYVFPEHKDVITSADLAIDSPYNTYLRRGLPPTPIANPGEPSLDAAFHPARSPYFYYVYRGDGHHAFAKTLAEHNANTARYLK